MKPAVREVLLAAAWAGWLLGTVRNCGGQSATKIDKRARLGLSLEMIGYAVVFLHRREYWDTPIEIWRAIAGGIFALASIVLFWNAVVSLGRQFRIDAGLNADHELVQTGAYRIVRHPIYSSMLGMMLATIFWEGTLPGWPIGLAVFLCGTEIRVRVEDALLAERFGEKFTEWRKTVAAYVPKLR